MKRRYNKVHDKYENALKRYFEETNFKNDNLLEEIKKINNMEETKIKPFLAYKGFSNDLSCNHGAATKTNYIIGETYSKEFKEKPKLCSNDGYHFCKKLNDVFQHYRRDGKNRFCLIEVLGPHTSDTSKSITTSFKIIKEIEEKEIDDILSYENIKPSIDKLKEFQIDYPLSHIGGSLGLFLHGIQLSRFKNFNSQIDFDVILPYYQIIKKKEENNNLKIDGVTLLEKVMEEEEVDYSSSNDFDEAVFYDGVKIDLKVDPHQKYEIINFEDFDFKVSKLENILEAKLRYAMTPSKSSVKHKKDIYEMVGKNHKK